jgi:hypothetical protein
MEKLNRLGIHCDYELKHRQPVGIAGIDEIVA